MKRTRTCVMFAAAALLLAGCTKSPFDEYRVGEPCDLQTMRSRYGVQSVSEATLAQTQYRYSVVAFEKGDAKVFVSVSPEGRVVKVEEIIPHGIDDDQREIVEDLAEKLKAIYRDKLVDCGAKESKVTLMVEGHETLDQVRAVCVDNGFAKLVDASKGVSEKERKEEEK